LALPDSEDSGKTFKDSGDDEGDEEEVLLTLDQKEEEVLCLEFKR
jgi:hypothetical protein